MKQKDYSSLDLPTLQNKRDRVIIVTKIVFGLILLYIGLMIYFLITKDWEVSRIGPLVAGMAGLAAASSSLRRKLKQMDEEITKRGQAGS